MSICEFKGNRTNSIKLEKTNLKRILLVIFIFLGLTPINFLHADNLASRLKGRILLQVESSGEAWYINPDNEHRYYLGRPVDAFQVMRDLGLGISNKDFDSFYGYAPKRLSGKILLKVEDNGKAYYVNPVDLKLHYLGRPADAFQVMRDLGLGISNNDLSTILESGQIDTSKLRLLSNSEIIEQLRDSVVYIETTDSAGSGFIIESNGYILTNAHVVHGKSSAYISLSDNQTFYATVVGRDENIDLALLKIDKAGLKSASLGDSLSAKQGDEIFTLGWPFGLKGDVSFKEGTISRTLDYDGYKYFEISADIHPGNSGGPLINQYGQVIGINTMTLGKTIYGVSLGETLKLSIPINRAKNYIPELKSGINILLPDNEPNESQYTPTPNDPPEEQANICIGEGKMFVSGYRSPSSREYENSNQTLYYLVFNIEALDECDVQVEDIKISMNYKYLTSDSYSKSNTVFEDIQVWEIVNNKPTKKVYSFGEWVEEKRIVFSSPLVVQGNSSKTYAIYSTIPRDIKGTYNMKIISASNITASNDTVSGYFPIIGDYITFE